MDKIEKSRKERILDFVNDSNYTKITVKQLAVIFGVPKEDIKYLDKIVSELEKEGKIYIDESKRICKLAKDKEYIGKYETKSRGFGFVRVLQENSDMDIYVERENSRSAYSGDTVLTSITRPAGKLSNAEGKVIKIISRGNKSIVGTFKKGDNFGFVIPFEKGMDDIYIPKRYMMALEDGEIVVAKIDKYATADRKAEGKVLETLGKENSKNIEREIVLKNAEIDEQFPFDVIDEAEQVSSDLDITEELNKRVDLRDKNIFTIDGDDTKDLDDAISIELQEDETYKLSVHIADVSFYVREGSKLDKEAIKRGTSIYIPGYVVPMLPRSLSNGICSLSKGEDRLTISIDMIVDKSGNVLFSNVYKSVINSKCQMTYNKVEKVLNKDKEAIKEYSNFVNDLNLMSELAKVLKDKRKKSGSIDFDIPESKITLDSVGEVISIEPYSVGISNGIIEEFMLLANKCIAKQFNDLGAPFIYRIHEKPDIEALREVNEAISRMGYAIKGINKIHPKAVAQVIDDASSDPREKQIISKLILRSLKLARYSSECTGHFGLNFEYYTHFTSPIRRYPDLFIHRVISEYLATSYNIESKEYSRLVAQSEEYAFSSSLCEKQATLIEREADSMYMAKYMKAHLGDTYEGVVSSVTKFGMYVKLDNTVEGLITLVNLSDDYYIYDEKNMTLLGRQTKKVYSVGDRLEVQVVRADTMTSQIDFIIYKEEKKNEEYTKSNIKRNTKR